MNQLINLTDEVKEELEKLAALGYSHEEMAVYFQFDQEVFLMAANDANSNIAYHIKRGQLMSIAKEQMALLDDAERGNVTASQHLGKIRRNRGWQMSKLDIFAGMEDKKLIDRLEDYITSGSITKMNVEEAIYIEALTLFNSMSRKYGRRNTIAFFTQEPFNLKYARAREMYDEAINLFYVDRNIEKKALRNQKAEQLEEAARIVFENAESAKDWEVYGDLIMKAAKLQELDKLDPEKLPAELYTPPIRVLSLDTTTIGLPAIDRKALAKEIEDLDIPERDKMRISQDAMMASFNLLEKLNELEEESKSEE
ncbi:MAG: hypothetical protein RIC03_12520 [Cyclobacteriaceae bacterium]